MMRSCRYAILLLLTAASAVAAQEQEPEFAKYLFPPELVMAHQQEIGLTDTQRQAIQGAMRDAQRRFVDLQCQMSGEVEKLQHAVQAPAPDETKVMEQLDPSKTRAKGRAEKLLKSYGVDLQDALISSSLDSIKSGNIVRRREAIKVLARTPLDPARQAEVAREVGQGRITAAQCPEPSGLGAQVFQRPRGSGAVAGVLPQELIHLAIRDVEPA